MKLYTEQQVMEMLRIAKNTYETIDNIINGFSEIELPTDEEIDNRSHSEEQEWGFRYGAQWMRDKIKGGEQ